MARKASDLVLLLGSRGKSRSRRSKSGLLGSLSRFLGGSSASHKGRSIRAAALPSWAVLGVALIAFLSGYFVRDRLGPSAPEAGPDLKAARNGDDGPRAPGLIDVDTTPLASNAYFVAVYDAVSRDVGLARAVALCEYLQEKGFPKARPYLHPAEGGIWCVTVYFSGADEAEDTRKQLLALPEDVPCPVFVGLRKQDSDWPLAFPIQ